MELFASAGKQLMGIGLIAGIPHDLVLRRIQQVLKCDRQFDHTQIRGEVPTDIGDRADDLFPDFLT